MMNFLNTIAITTVALDGSCDTAQGESAVDGDCNDSFASVNPGAAEIVGDGIDQDCNGFDTVTCYLDNDSDGFGSAASGVIQVDDGACNPLDGESALDTDCNDALATAFPGAAEVIGDGIDQDCDGHDDCYQDLDGDNYGTALILTDNDLDCSNASAPFTAAGFRICQQCDPARPQSVNRGCWRCCPFGWGTGC